MSYIVPILTVIGSFGGAWLAAQLALRRFYRERIWERKAAAYTAILEAMHDMGRWYDEHFEAAIEQYEMDKDDMDELARSYNHAKLALSRRLASETWLLPDECIQLMDKMEKDLRYDGENWQDHLEAGAFAIRSALGALRPIVRKEMNI